MFRVSAAAVVALAVTGLAGCAAGEPASRPWTQPKSERAYATAPPTGSPARELTARKALEQAVGNTASVPVRVRGTVTDRFGVTHRLDLRFGQGGSSGTLTAGESTARVLRVGKDVWINAPFDFWAAVAGSNFAAGYRNKYVKVPAGDPAFAGLVRNTYADKLIALFTQGAGEPAKGTGKATLDRRPAVPLHVGGGASGYGGTVWVSADGAPQLLRITASPGSPVAGRIDFTDYGKRHHPAPPRPDQVAD